MFTKVFLAALAASSFVAAHGKIAVITGDAGGNTTALGIQGGVIPGAGSNSKTEIDTTVFNRRRAATDGLGKTTAGPNSLQGMSAVIEQSGSTLPQVSDGGSISGIVHIVTTDGAGPYTAICDPTGTGSFSTGTKMTVTKQVPGTRGNIAASNQRRFVPRMLVGMGLIKRASNVNEDFPFEATMPAGMTCSGTVGGQSNVCLVKIANPSGAGPFGGVVAVQMAGGASASTNSTSAGESTAESSTNAAKGCSADKTIKAGRMVSAKFRI